MRISVKVKTHARTNAIRRRDDQSFEITVNAPPVDGKANEAVIELLAKYFRKPKGAIRIRSGASSKFKIVEIDD